MYRALQSRSQRLAQLVSRKSFGTLANDGVEPGDLLRWYCRERGLVFSHDRVGFARELERIAGAASVRVQGTTYTAQRQRVTVLNSRSTE